MVVLFVRQLYNSQFTDLLDPTSAKDLSVEDSMIHFEVDGSKNLRLLVVVNVLANSRGAYPLTCHTPHAASGWSGSAQLLGDAAFSDR